MKPLPHQPPDSQLLAEHARLAERALAADARFRAVLEANEAGFAIVEVELDADGKPHDYLHLEANAAFEVHSGVVGVVGRRAREIAQADPWFWVQKIGEVALTGAPLRFEGFAHGRWLAARLSRFGDAKSRQVAMVVTDITDSRRAAKALEDAHERLDATLRAAEIATYSWDVKKDRVFADPNFAKMFGVSAEDANGGPIARYIGRMHPDDQDRVRAAVQTALETGRPFQSEYRLVGEQGIRTVLVRGQVCLAEDGTPMRFPGVAIDITDQRRVEAALATVEGRLAIALQAGRLGTWDLDVATMAMTCSDTCKGNYGFPAGTPFSYEELQGAVHPDDIVRWGKVVGEAIATGSTFEMEYRTCWPDHSVHWVLVRGTCAVDENGKAVSMSGVSMITDAAKRVEEELISASHRKDEFLAMASHELRTPLNAILGWARMLRSGQLDPSGYLRAVETIERNAKAQVQLIDDILDGSRIITGKLYLEIRALDMTAVVAAATDAIRPAAEAKQISLTVSYDPLAGALVGDPDRLQQIVWNLVNNAIKFSPRGGSVNVELAKRGSNIELVVRDDGQGISSEFLPHVFERFRQGDESTTRRHGGLGLGLALVRHLVEAHGGVVSAHSDGPGKGARFSVSLPVRALHESKAPPVSRSFVDAGRIQPMSLVGVMALVVDDELDARELVATVLRANGAEVMKVASVAEAIRALDTTSPTVLISDIGMPDADGYALIEHVRSQIGTKGADVPAVALTAYAREEDRRRAIEAGYHTHVAKPVEPVELVRVISNLVKAAANR